MKIFLIICGIIVASYLLFQYIIVSNEDRNKSWYNDIIDVWIISDIIEIILKLLILLIQAICEAFSD